MSFLKKIILSIYEIIYPNYDTNINSKLFNYGNISYDGKTLVLKTATNSEYISVRIAENEPLLLNRKYYEELPITRTLSDLKENILNLSIFDKVYKGYYLISSISESKSLITVSEEARRHAIHIHIRKIDYSSYLDVIPIEILYIIALRINIRDNRYFEILDRLKYTYIFTWEKYFKDTYPKVYQEFKDVGLIPRISSYENAWEVILDLMASYNSEYNPKKWAKLLQYLDGIYYLHLETGDNLRFNLETMILERVVNPPTTHAVLPLPGGFRLPGVFVL